MGRRITVDVNDIGDFNGGYGSLLRRVSSARPQEPRLDLILKTIAFLERKMLVQFEQRKNPP